MTVDNTNSGEVMSLTTQLTEDALSTWTDEKRKDFINTFDARTRVSQFILLATAEKVSDQAFEKHFISSKHTSSLPDNFHSRKAELYDVRAPYPGESSGGRYTSTSTYNVVLMQVGGRSVDELKEIAEERARDILSSLPPLKQAVEIISPEVSKQIEERDRLLEQGKKLVDESKDLNGPLDMDDFDQEMTLAEFRSQAKARQKRRAEVLQKLNEMGTEGRRLDNHINKFLYSGLPGLSQAVVEVVTSYVEKATAFSALNRRVSEKVQFGDSAAAVDLLKGFEKDEVTVSADVKAQFTAALEKLKLAGAKKGKPKQIKNR